MILILLLFAGTILSEVVCPDPATYWPCECTEYTGPNSFPMTTSTLDCSNRNLTDSLLNDILNVFTLNPLISQVNHLLLYSNQITRIPTQIPLMRWLTYVNLSGNNIQSVETASFDFASNKMNLIDLSSNQIKSIQPDAFQGIPCKMMMIIYLTLIYFLKGSYVNYSKIYLDKNNLTRFERDVFLSVLQQMAPDIDFPYGYTSIGQSIKELFVFNC